MALLDKTKIYQGAQYFCRAADVEELYNSLGALPAVTLTPGANVAIDASAGTVFKITPDQAMALTVSPVGKNRIYLIVTTSGTVSFNMTFSTGFKANTLATGTVSAKVFVMSFQGNGTVYHEASRTAAM